MHADSTCACNVGCLQRYGALLQPDNPLPVLGGDYIETLDVSAVNLTSGSVRGG